MFENPSKCRIFKNSPKLTVFGIFDELLSIQNVNVARFARNVKCDFFCDFQTPYVRLGWFVAYLKHCGDQRKKNLNLFYVSKYALKQQQMT